MERARTAGETQGNGNFLTRAASTISGTAKITAAAIAVFLAAENKANAQFPRFWPPAPPAPSWWGGDEEERLKPLSEQVTSVKQHPLTELSCPEGDAFIEKLRRNHMPQMDRDEFMTREQASRMAWEELHALTRRMNPPPNNVLQALDL